MRETVLLAIVGVITGNVLTLVAKLAFWHWIPTLTVVLSVSWLLQAAMIAISGAVVGALYPAYKAAQKDPIDALAYE
jgi:putative ABC transport system permease protein